MGDFQGDFERFPEIFPHRREREKNAAKQIVRIDNQSIIHKTLHLLTIEPRRGPDAGKNGFENPSQGQTNAKRHHFLVSMQVFPHPDKASSSDFLSFRRVFYNRGLLRPHPRTC